MSPEVTAAAIAAGASVLTLVGTVIAQVIGFRTTKADTERQIKATHKDTADTLEQQREQLTQTLKAQSEQLDRTLAEQRTRTLNERFSGAAEQLGSEKPAVRLAGVYAMAALADDWEENRQVCVDVLCSYLRMPYEPDPGRNAPEPQRLAFQAIREVGQTAIRVITSHLQKDAEVSWQGLNFDFTGVVFDGGDFSDAQFSGGMVDFGRAQFSGNEVSFSNAQFSGGRVYFRDARFFGGTVDFSDAEFSGSEVYFSRAQFSGGEVYFGGAEFSGGKINFDGADFVGGTVDFSKVDNWSSPPEFPWTDTPPSGVTLPKRMVHPRG